MTRKIEIYNDNSNTAKLTINNERITLKICRRYENIDFYEFIKTLDNHFTDVKHTYRSRVLVSLPDNVIFTYINIEENLVCKMVYSINTKETVFSYTN